MISSIIASLLSGFEKNMTYLKFTPGEILFLSGCKSFITE